MSPVLYEAAQPCEIDMITALVHEIKNPAAVALAHVGLLRQAGSDGERLANCERIASALDDIAELAHQMLCVVHGTPLVSSFDLYACLEEMCETYQEAWPNINFTLHRYAAPIQFHAHEASMRMVFSNLLKNAAEAVTPHGCVNIYVHLEDDWVRVCIHDDGSNGTAAIDLEHVKPRGNGLGLPITRWLLQRLGGTLTLNIGEMGGCEAVVRLPR